MNGGYDDGYSGCPCFWGSDPGSLVKLLCSHLGSLEGLRILDAGCGEGKNAVFLAQKGACVDAVDISELAIHNGRKHWPDVTGVNWRIADIQSVEFADQQYDIVIAYGLLHCMPSEHHIRQILSRLQSATRTGGYNVICAFNSRSQDLRAHPEFKPVLLSHSDYSLSYRGWRLISDSDADLTEQHPHNRIVHKHSLTRILAQRTEHECAD